MKTPLRPENLRPEDWAQHVRSLRNLAREIVGDPEQRDELVQNALVAALERPPRALSWTWLATVLRNRARDLARTRSRQGRSEPLEPLASSLPAADEIAQRLELQEQLTQALRALGEPYQSTLYLRYFEELTPSAIAQRTGVPLKTVKTRLERGLALLRQRLEHRHGPGARAFVLLLRPLPGGASASIPVHPSSAGTFTAGGLVLMWKKIALAAVALLALALLWRTTLDSERGVSAERAPDVVLGTAPVAHDDVPVLVPPPAAVTREATLATTAVEHVAPTTGSLRVHVRWSDGTDAPDIALDVRANRPGTKYPGRGLLRVTSDAQGVALASELVPGPLSVASRGASAQGEVIAGEERALELTLPDGLEIAGRVLDEHDAPLAGAEIRLTSAYIDWLGMTVVAVTDSAGRFTLRDVPGTQSLGATAAGHSPSKLVDLDLVDRRASPVEVVLRCAEKGGALAGRVLDAQGAVVPGALVCVGRGTYGDYRTDDTFQEHWAPRLTRSDETGNFRFEGLSAGPLPVEVRAPAAPLWSTSTDVQTGVTTELTVTLQASATLTGVVHDAQGAPVVRAFVRAFALGLAPHFLAHGQYDDPSVFGSPLTLTDAAGHYRLDGVWPGEAHVYASPPRGEDDMHSEFHAEEVLQLGPDETREWNPVLEPGRTIRGHALYSDGEPMNMAWVSAREERDTNRRSLTTDDAGRFEFFNLPPGPFRVEVQLAGLSGAPSGARPLFATGVFPDGSELELVADFPSPERAPSARVRGHFVDPGARFTRPLSAMLEAGSMGHYPDSSEGGAFEFVGLAAGRYRVVGHFSEQSGDLLAYVGEEFELAKGEQRDLGELEVRPGAALTLHLRRAPGLEQVKVSAYLHPGTHLDFAHGDDVVRPNLTRGSYVLTLDCGTEAAQYRREFDLAGDMELDVPLLPSATRKIELELPPAGAQGTLHLTLTGDDGVCYEDTTYARNWNEHSPFVTEVALPVGHFMVKAVASIGLSAAGELTVEAPATVAEPLHLVLR